MSDEIDTSDIPEVGEEWFRQAKLRTPASSSVAPPAFMCWRDASRSCSDACRASDPTVCEHEREM